MLVGNTCCPVPALEADQKSRPKKPRAPYYAGACGKHMYLKCRDGHTPRYRHAVTAARLPWCRSRLNPDL